jgi:hypothetical protein
MKTKLLYAFSIMLILQACSGGGSNSGDGAGNGGEKPSVGNNNSGSSSGDTPALIEARDKCANTPAQGNFDIRYVFSENINGQACTTGCQLFSSQSSYCSGLKSDQLNNNCAKASREKSFQDSCVSP